MVRRGEVAVITVTNIILYDSDILNLQAFLAYRMSLDGIISTTILLPYVCIISYEYIVNSCN
jgi:hypothetical protein